MSSLFFSYNHLLFFWKKDLTINILSRRKNMRKLLCYFYKKSVFINA